jgi:hypothetical protein
MEIEGNELWYNADEVEVVAIAVVVEDHDGNALCGCSE